MVLNLCCADHLLSGAVNVDKLPQKTAPGCLFVQADLDCRWPFRDACFERVIARDAVEHLRSKRHVMNEAYRVLRPGGTFAMFVPLASGAGAWQDPTHASFWTANDLLYYCIDAPEHRRFARSYGILAAFRLKSLRVREYTPFLAGFRLETVRHLEAELEAVK